MTIDGEPAVALQFAEDVEDEIMVPILWEFIRCKLRVVVLGPGLIVKERDALLALGLMNEGYFRRTQRWPVIRMRSSSR